MNGAQFQSAVVGNSPKTYAPAYRYALVACARWEADSIVEWLTFHRLIGFEHVYLYCNDEDPRELYQAIMPFGAFVTFHHYGLQGHQEHMYRHFLLNHVNETESFAFLDIDEFLLLRHCDSIAEFVAQYQNVDAIHFNSVDVSYGGYETRPPGPVIRNYRFRSKTAAGFTKCIARSSAFDLSKLVHALFGAWWHNIDLILNDDAKIVNVLGIDMRGYYPDLDNRWRALSSIPSFHERLIDAAFIFHVGMKSEQDLLRRYQRGTGGSFFAQTVWRDIHKLGPEEVRKTLNRFDFEEEARLVELMDAALSHAFDGQIVPPPPGKNLALGCCATQSSICSWSRHQNISLDAEGPINGKAHGLWSHHTDTEDDPWWQVDLGAISTVREIRIFNRIDAVRDRFRNFVIRGSLDGEEWFVVHMKNDDHPFGGLDGFPFIWRAPNDSIALRYLRIQGIGHSCLDLDQVEIY